MTFAPAGAHCNAISYPGAYTPLTAGPLNAVSEDANLPDDRISNFDKLYLAGSTALDNRLEAIGLTAA